MSDSPLHNFSKFVPGFDFLQNLSQGKASGVAGPSSWVAPTLDPKELDKRIEELKAVQFWLDQNATALKATIQAMEVQKMTLATLQGMNLDMDAMSKAFQFPTAASANKTAAAPDEPPPASTAKKSASKTQRASAATPAVDPVQLWTSLTQQFQQIASNAMQEVGKQAAQHIDQQAKKTASTTAAGSTRASAPKPAAKKSAQKPASRR